MLVALAIIGIITAVALTSQSSFNKTVLVSAAAYDLALSIRNAESSGIATGLPRFYGGGSLSGFNFGYGVDFYCGSYYPCPTTSTQNTFTVFADNKPTSGTNGRPLCYSSASQVRGASGSASDPDAKVGDCVYSSSTDTLVSTYTLGNGIVIDNVCGVATSNLNNAYNTSCSAYCWNTSGVSSASNVKTKNVQLDVVFARPNTAATIMATEVLNGVSNLLSYNNILPGCNGAAGSSNAPDHGRNLDSLCVALKGTGTNPTKRYIFVNALGQVSVSNTSCLP